MRMTSALTGRVGSGPSQILHDEILLPQFRYEVRHLLPWYLLIEKILVLEYQRLGLLSGADGRRIAARLHEIDPDLLIPDPRANLSDPALAIERFVESRLAAPVPSWHVDRSRNDLQASAQLMAGRHRLLRVAEGMLDTVGKAVDLAARFTGTPMPGYTQGQAAQVVTPGFHLAALADQLLRHAERMLDAFDAIDLSPLGAGAMAGQEVGFDRAEMARLAGFTGVQTHALVAVASRGWALEIAAALSVFGVTLSRLLTDVLDWGGSDRGFLTVPDTLAGISSAMPQKRNIPVLERLRGKTGHLVSGYIDVALAQRNTPFTNMVEVSKESTAGLVGLFDTADAVLRLLAAVLGEAGFHPDRMRAACEGEYLGGFTLANRLTMRAGVPWRTAQVIAGRYITAATAAGRAPADTDPEALAATAAAAGYPLDDAAALLDGVFQVDAGLAAKTSPGSTGPEPVRAMLDDQRAWLQRSRCAVARRASRIDRAVAEVDERLGLTHRAQEQAA